VVQAGIEPATLALLAQSSNQLSYWTFIRKEFLKLNWQILKQIKQFSWWQSNLKTIYINIALIYIPHEL
jgi:hypothetical protein